QIERLAVPSPRPLDQGRFIHLARGRALTFVHRFTRIGPRVPPHPQQHATRPVDRAHSCVFTTGETAAGGESSLVTRDPRSRESKNVSSELRPLLPCPTDMKERSRPRRSPMSLRATGLSAASILIALLASLAQA